MNALSRQAGVHSCSGCAVSWFNEPQNGTGTQRRSCSISLGAPAGNTNRQRHGLYGSQLPKGCGNINNALRRLRRQLESAVVETFGDITVQDAALVNSAMRHERRVKLCERWLREEYGDLDIDDRMKIQKEISDATDSRHRCIEKLKLGRTGGPTALYAGMSDEELLKRVVTE